MKKILFVLGIIGLAVSMNAKAEISIQGYQFSNGLLRINIDGSEELKDTEAQIKTKTVYIDKTGKVVIPPTEYEILGDFVYEYIPVIDKKQKFGYINTTGKLVIKPIFQDARTFDEELAGAKLNNKWGFIDKSGKWVIKPKFYDVRGFATGFASVQHDKDGKWGFIDKTGNYVIESKFEEAFDFDASLDGHASVVFNGHRISIDRDGNRVTPYPFELEPYCCNEGIGITREEGKQGYIDKTGKVIIERQFDKAYMFTEGLAPVKIGDKWSYIDTTGKIVLDPPKSIYDNLEQFSEGLAIVYTNDGLGVYDKSGNWVISPEQLKKSLAKYVALAEKEEAKALKAKAQKEDKLAKEVARKEASQFNCSPPKGDRQQYEDECTNGDCVRTYSNGCKKRIQASHCYDSLQGDWVWKIDGC